MKKNHSPAGTIPARILASGLRLTQVYRDSKLFNNGHPSGKLVMHVRFSFAYPDAKVPRFQFMEKYGMCYPNGSYVARVGSVTPISHGVSWDIMVIPDSPIHKRTFYWQDKLHQLQQLLD